MSEAPTTTRPRSPFLDLNEVEVIRLDESGAACWSCVSGWLEGTPELGIQAAAVALADSVLAYGASTRSPPGLIPVTVGMRVDFVRLPPSMGARLTSQATVVLGADDLLLVRGELETSDAILATAVVRAMQVPVAGPTPPPRLAPPPVVQVVPPAGEADLPTTGRLDHLLMLPAARLAGLELIRAGVGTIELRAEPDGRFERSEGVVHGGAVPIIGQLGGAAALASAFPDAVSPRRLDITTEYLRPMFVGEMLTVRARIVHQARRVMMTHVEILNADTKPVARVYETGTWDR